MNSELLENINKVIDRNYDYFLCCSSFEERCLAIAKVLERSKIEKAIIFYNEDQKGKITENVEKLKSLLAPINTISLHSDNPVMVISKLHESVIENILKFDRIVNLLIDISTFTHETLLMLFRLLSLQKEKIKVSICYTNVKEYSYNVKDTSEKWLTKGVGDVRNIIGYPGYINPSRKNHLIILFGFEVERTIRIIEKFEPDFVSIGYASENTSTNQEHFKINQQRHQELGNNYPNLNVFTTSLVDPYQTKLDLLAQIEKFPNTNIIIAPMNTKLSTLGAALAFESNQDIQLCYVKANLYNSEGYSLTGDTFYFFKIQFA